MTAPICHLAPGKPVEGFSECFLNWMNALMLGACLPGCWLLCPRSGNCGRDLLSHLTCAAGMCLGMVLGGGLLGAAWSGHLGMSGGMHLSMLLGMLGGAGGSISFGSLARGIRS